MKVTGLRTGRGVFGPRFSADVAWEDSERPPLAIGWELDDELGVDARPEPNAFLTAVFLPALRHRERRIAVEGSVCPLLGEGLAAAGRIVQSWSASPPEIPSIEPLGWKASMPRSRPAAAGYLTGGVDSLHLFHANREDFPPDHPARLSHALWVRGLDDPGGEESARSISRYARLETPLREIAADAGVKLVRITTNLRRLDPDLVFFAHRFLGAALLSGAHLLTNRFSTVALASSWPAEHLIPWGTHPLLDVRYGSSALTIRHEALGLGRVEKLSRLRGRPEALARLITCSDAPAEETLNCGRCAKCVRTLVEMEASGTLEHARSFPAGRVTPAVIAGLELGNGTEYFWGTLVSPMRTLGRDDLAAAIESKIRETVRRTRRVEGRDWTGPFRRFDREVLGGRVKRLLRRGSA
jgi:hypothetical protein